MDYSRSYAASYQMVPVLDGWHDGEPIVPTSMAVNADGTESSPLLASATASWSGAARAVPSGLFRFECLARQRGGLSRTALGAYYMTMTDAEHHGGGVDCSFDGRSVLAPAADEEVPAGTYAPRGSDAATWAAGMLSVCQAPVSVHGRAVLADHVVVGDGTSRLDAAWAALRDVGWRIRLGWDGGIHIEPLPQSPSLTIDEQESHGIRPTVSERDGVVTYVRDWADGVHVGDVVRLDLPRLGIVGTYRIESQSVEVGGGLAVTEKARRL